MVIVLVALRGLDRSPVTTASLTSPALSHILTRNFTVRLGGATNLGILAALLEVVRRLWTALGLAEDKVLSVNTVTRIDRRNVLAAVIAADRDQNAIHDLDFLQELIGLLLEIANPLFGGQSLEGDASEVDGHQRNRGRIVTTAITSAKVNLDHQLIDELARGELEVTLIPTDTTTLGHLINNVDELTYDCFGELANHY